MNELAMSFSFETVEVRTMLINKEPWFVGVDVALAATVGHTQEAITAMGTYSEVFKAAGYDADDMFTIMINGAQEFGVEKLGDLGKNLATFQKNLTDGSKETQKTLKALGIEATDLPAKFQEGGETAAQAFQLVLTKLLSIEDKAKQAEIAKSLFGDMNWTKNGEDMARLFLEGFDSTMDVEGQAQRTADAWSDTLANNIANTKEIAGQAVGTITQPFAEAGNEAIKALNEKFSEGDLLGGLWSAFLTWGDGLHSIIDPALDEVVQSTGAKLGEIGEPIVSALDEAGQEVDAKLGEISTSVSEKFYAGAQEGTDTSAADTTAQRWVDVLRGSVDAAAAEGEQSEAVKGMLDGMLPDTTALTEGMKTYAESHKAAVVAQMEEAYGQENDEDFEAWKTFQQAMIDSAYEDSVDRAEELGEDVAASDVAAIDAAQDDARRAGEELGRESVDGLSDGGAGMADAAADTVDGAIGELYAGVGKAYSAGFSTGKAYEKGYKEALDQHSPSRLMAENAADTDAGALDQYEKDRQRFAEAGAELANAMAGGFSGGGVQTGRMAVRETGDVDYEALGDAVANAIARAGMGFYVGGRRLAEVCEPEFSRMTQERAQSTIKGQAASIKGW